MESHPLGWLFFIFVNIYAAKKSAVNMNNKISRRLEEIIDALPLQEGIRILEIGCGTGVAAREIVTRLKNVYLLGIDRSEKAIEQCKSGSSAEIANGKLHFQHVAVEDFNYTGSKLFDFAFAIRVGALDGRHPEIEKKAVANIAKALTPGGRLFIDGGNPIKEINIDTYS